LGKEGKNTMSKIYAAILGVVTPGLAFAADTPFTVTAPTFDWSVCGTVAGSMLLLAVAIVGYKKVKMLINRG
jgi:hypothetical protein